MDVSHCWFPKRKDRFEQIRLRLLRHIFRITCVYILANSVLIFE